jgi:antitoxin component of MazEF toxin-antitoxin module
MGRFDMPGGGQEVEGLGDLSATGYPWISSCGDAPTSHTRGQPAASRQPRPLRIGRWGNVLAVRLPQALCTLLHLQLGDDLDLQLLSSGQLLLTPAPRRSRLALCAALQEAADQR